jgi:hypothetical protein
MSNEHQLRFAYEAGYGSNQSNNPPMTDHFDENRGTFIKPRASMMGGPLPGNTLRIPFPPGTNFDNQVAMDEDAMNLEGGAKKTRKSKKSRKSKKTRKSRKSSKSKKHNKRH